MVAEKFWELISIRFKEEVGTPPEYCLSLNIQKKKSTGKGVMWQAKTKSEPPLPARGGQCKKEERAVCFQGKGS